jgi:hypothetical protein
MITWRARAYQPCTSAPSTAYRVKPSQVRNTPEPWGEFPLREALGEFMRAAGLVRRIGVNLNQAVAKLNATGQRSGDLLPYAAKSIRRARLLDQAAEEVRRRIQQ